MKKNICKILSVFIWIFCSLSSKTYSQGMGVGIATPISVLHVYENTTNVGTTAGLTIEQNSTGDAIIQYLLTGGQRWVEGIDNSDADKFKISSTVDVGSAPRITIQTTGEVGVNKAAPEEMLHVGSNTGATDNYVKVQANGAQKAGIKFVGGTINIWHLTHDDNTAILQIGMDASEWMTFTNVGRVGIGTTSPASLLDVEGGASIGATYSGTTAAPANGAIIEGSVGIGTNAPASKLDVEGGVSIGATYSGTTAAPANGAIIEGSVGIGTNAPSTTLDIEGTSPSFLIRGTTGAAYASIIRIAGEANNDWKGGYIEYDGTGGAGVVHFGVHNAADQLTTSDVVAMTLDRATAHVGIGTSTFVTNALLSLKDGHLQIQQTTAPTIATGAASTAASLSNATDIAGKISITTNTTAGVGATITFNKAYTVAPVVILTPTNANAAAQMVSAQVNVTSTTTTFVINFSAAPTATAKTFNYAVIETQ